MSEQPDFPAPEETLTHLTCPVSLAWTLKLGGGNNASAGVRRMRSAAGNFVPYRIYRESGRTTLIAIDGTVTGTGNGASGNPGDPIPLSGSVFSPAE